MCSPSDQGVIRERRPRRTACAVIRADWQKWRQMAAQRQTWKWIYCLWNAQDWRHQWQSLCLKGQIKGDKDSDLDILPSCQSPGRRLGLAAKSPKGKQYLNSWWHTPNRFGSLVLHIGREYVSVCQLWGEEAGERARLPFWSLCLKQCGGTERSTPTQLTTPNRGLRRMITMADTPHLTDTVAIFVKSHAWQTPIVIFFSFLQSSVGPPRLQWAVQCPAFTTPKDFSPSPPSLSPCHCLQDVSNLD